MPLRPLGALRPRCIQHRALRSPFLDQSLLGNSFPTHFARSLTTQIKNTEAFQTDAHKERVVILGSGWGGYTLSRRISPNSFSPIVISPRSYFVFTPLLTDAASGSLDFSNIVEPVRDPHAKVDFIQAAARSIDLKKKTVLCEATVVKSGVTETSTEEEKQDDNAEATKKHRWWEQGEMFEVPYDKLVIAVGAVSRTFGTPGVKENAFFFRDIGDAKHVKRRIRECFELAVLPTTAPEMRKWLLHFAIVGAGPTGTELAASLRDFLHKDMMSLYPALDGTPKITLYDVAPNVLSTFDESLSRYARETLKSEGIDIKTSHHVESLRWGAPGESPPHEMDPKRCLTIKTKEEGEVGIGMCVWATGNAPNKFIRALNKVDEFPAKSVNTSQPTKDEQVWEFKKVSQKGPLLVDGYLRVQLQDETGRTAVLQDVYALGDNAMIETGAPPATAQATFQEAKWLATRMNKKDVDQIPPFSFRNLGAMAYIGNEKALMQIPHDDRTGKRSKYLPEGITGRMAHLIWRAAYLSMSFSTRNKLKLAFRWTINRIFGRDISRF
ncbi:hypothetical protein N7490_009890 [Penicillium lividum]|nr:hypothetical protein N7490_009890 [Penicillium lividum]